jgi:HlyD family secretion protein
METVLRKREDNPDEPLDEKNIAKRITEVAKPIFFATLIIIIAYLPLFAFGSVEKKLFTPMAFTLSFALLGALATALILLPGLAFAIYKKPQKVYHNRWLERLTEIYKLHTAKIIDTPKKIIIPIAVILLSVFGLSIYVGKDFLPYLDEGSIWLQVQMPPGISLEKSKERPIPVAFSKVEKRTIIQVVSATGKIQPETQIKISPEVSGEIVNLTVKEGDTVTKNTLLARINPAIIETQLAQYQAMVNASKEDVSQIKAQLNNLEIELKRTKELYEKKYVSKQEMDKAQANYEATVASYNGAIARSQSTTATLQQIQTEAKKTNISAPIDGIITSLLVEKGERVVGTNMMTGTEMMTVSDLTVMNAEVDVDENDIVLVKVGDTATVEIDAFSEKVYKGIVVEVGHSASGGMAAANQTTTFRVKIRLLDSEEKLRPGMSCNVEIHTARHENVLSVPLQSVTSRDDEEKKNTTAEANSEDNENTKKQNIRAEKQTPKTIVFLRSGDIVKQREVKVGISDMGFIEIISGLSEGEEVVSGSYQAISRLLSDGSKVKEEEKTITKNS